MTGDLEGTAPVRVIAIDGPSGSGKSTVAGILARRLGLSYLDTGAMYRALTLKALEAGIPPTDGRRLGKLASELDFEMSGEGRVLLGGKDVGEAIRSRRVDRAVSEYSAVPEVRRALVEKQRRYACEGAVVEGRDIATAVFPDAAVRVFLTATPEERARRRWRIDTDRTFEELIEDMERRDRLDSTRKLSPLRPAKGAVVIDTTGLDPEEVADRIAELWASAGEKGEEV